MIEADFIVVGSGLTGSTIARMLTDLGQQVVILDRKDHLGGNVYDYKHESGAMIHKYGPHYFRCSSEKIWNFLNRFTQFYNWSATILSKVNDDYFNWPVNQDFIEAIAGKDWNLFMEEPSNFEEACLSKMPVQLYEMFIKGYTEKQWGVDAKTLDKELAARITINKSNVYTLTPNHKWNALPENGYTQMVKNMIDEIPLHLDFDFLKNTGKVSAKKMLIFTGPIDEFFNYKYGKLKYRGQKRRIEFLETTDQFQPCMQVNYPAKKDSRIRTIEWKHLLKENEKSKVQGTVLTHETPFTPGEANQFEYPFPDQINRDLYKQYRNDADLLKNTLICGRLGEYRYYDMDQAIGRAMKLALNITEKFNIPAMQYA